MKAMICILCLFFWGGFLQKQLVAKEYELFTFLCGFIRYNPDSRASEALRESMTVRTK